MSIMPVFPVRLMMLLIPVALAVVILAVVGKRGISVFKKQGVAWGLTVLMVFAAIGIGYAKAPINGPVPEPGQAVPSTAPTIPPAGPYAIGSFVRDDAGVLSSQTVKTLDERNQRLYGQYNVVVGVVTCGYGGDDLGSLAMKYAEDMGLGGCDFIVVLDISGDNYWLIQGAELVQDFTDADCSDYAYNYMEEPFARGDYDSAVLQLTERLETWYGVYYWLS